MAETKAAEEGLEQLARLEQKIQRAIELLHSARAEKEELQGENAQLRRKLAEQDQSLRLLHEQLHRMEKDRDNIKTRVQKILEQVDTLTQAAADAG